MAKYAGFDFLLKMGDGAGSETFTTVANCTTNSLSINNEPIDVTDKSGNHFREIIDGGIVSVSLSGEGVFSNNAQVGLLITKSLSPSANIANYKITIGTGTFTGPFKLTKLDLTGAHNGAQTFSISLESTGTVTFA